MSDPCFVEIYHNVSRPFQPFRPGDVLKYQYEYQVEGGTSLDNVWRDNNVVSGREYPVEYETRSLSVGDGFAITTGYLTEFYVVASFGFTKVTSRDFYRGANGCVEPPAMFEAIGFVDFNVEG